MEGLIHCHEVDHPFIASGWEQASSQVPLITFHVGARASLHQQRAKSLR
jgi:hypothetical protein